MEKKEQLWERLAPIVLEREQGFGDITVGRATDQQGKDNLLNFIFQELSKAREEGRIEQLKEDIEQVEMFLPKQVSDTDKYWIPTQILLELEDDLKLLKTKGEEKR